MRTITAKVGPIAAASSNNIAQSQSLAAAGPLLLNGTTAGNLDVARQIVIRSAGDDTTKTWTIVGTNWTGSPISETAAGTNNTNILSVLDYLTVTSISLNAASASTVTAGTTTVAGGPWIFFDQWANAQLAVQTSVSGTITSYTLYTSLDDPNDYGNPVAPASMAWDSSASPFVGATTGSIASLATSPKWAKVVLTSSSTGSVTARFTQFNVANV